MTSSNDFCSSVDILLNTEFSGKIRNAIINHFNEIPHHPYRDFDAELVIEKITYLPAYLAQMSAQYEERSLSFHSEPYTRQMSPGTYPDFSNLYSINLARPNNFTDTTNSYTYPGPLSTCSSCEGRGQTTCMACGGKGENTCSNCGGVGKRTCSSCGGSGKKACNECNFWGMVRKTCYSCNGTGKQYSYEVSCSSCFGTGKSWGASCYYCGGTGRRTPEVNCSTCGGGGYRSAVCSNCSGYKEVTCGSCYYGEIRCNYCSGAGVLRCRKCSGTGNVTCAVCKGKGMFISYAVLRQQLYTERTDLSKVNVPDLEKKFGYSPELKDAIAKPIYIRKEKKLPSQIALGNEPIEQIYSRQYKEQFPAGKNNAVMQFQQFEVHKVNTYLIECIYKFESFPLLLYGIKDTFIDINSPIKRYRESLVVSAGKHYGDNQFVACYDDMKKVVEMGKVSPCEKEQRIFQKVSGHIIKAYSYGNVMGAILFLFLLPLAIPFLRVMPGFQTANSIGGLLIVCLLSSLIFLFSGGVIFRKMFGYRIQSDRKRFLIGTGVHILLMATIYLIIVVCCNWLV